MEYEGCALTHSILVQLFGENLVEVFGFDLFECVVFPKADFGFGALGFELFFLFGWDSELSLKNAVHLCELM